MVSDSEVLAGQHDHRRLETALAQKLDRFASVHVGQAHIHDHQVDGFLARTLNALGSRLRRDDLELFVKGQLFDQALAEHIVVVDNKDLADGHNRTFVAAEPDATAPAIGGNPFGIGVGYGVDRNRPAAQAAGRIAKAGTILAETWPFRATAARNLRLWTP